MRVLFVAGREIEYSRNAVLLDAFRKCASVEVIADTTTSPRYWLRTVTVIARAFWALWKGEFDLVFIGFYGHILLRVLGPFIRVPILFDAFVSNYDTLCFDRKVFAPQSLFGRMAFWLDNTNVHRATHILLDTEEHAKYFVSTFGLDASKVSVFPVGCRDDLFFPHEQSPTSYAARTQVLYYCTFLPLHGVGVVLDAANLLVEEPIDFCIIGDGPQRKRMVEYADMLALQNLTWTMPVPVDKLADEIAKADICLGGHFGSSDKAKRVVPGKIYQMLAMGSAVIASDSAANGRFLSDKKNALLIPPQDPAALADAIRHLHQDREMRNAIGAGGRQLYLATASESVITAQLCKLAKELVEIN